MFGWWCSKIFSYLNIENKNSILIGAVFCYNRKRRFLMKKCKKCNSEHNLTVHHNYPVCHFGKRHNNDKTILCETCHRRVETYIMTVESFLSNAPFGRRYKLQYYEYKKIKDILHL